MPRRQQKKLVRYKQINRRAKRHRAYLNTVERANALLQEPGRVRLANHRNQYGVNLRAVVVQLGDWIEHQAWSALTIGEKADQ